MSIVSIGSGQRLIVLHGGPGFSHRYLYQGLSFLAYDQELIFYDQPGCGKLHTNDIAVSLENTATHFSKLCRSLSKSQPLGVIAHSWGGLVLLAALQQSPSLLDHIGDVLFINPIPFDRKNYEAARHEFIKRLPVKVLQAYEALIADPKNGSKIMALLLPFYSSRPTGLRGEDFDLNLATYKSINDSLGDFDYLEQLGQLQKIKILLGEKDFVHLEHLPFTGDVSSIYVMPSVGHFPFYEEAHFFQTLLKNT